MPALSFERLLKSSRLAMPTPKHDAFIVDRSIRLMRPDRERLEGKVQKSRGIAGGRHHGDQLDEFANKLKRRLKQDKKQRSKSGRKRTKAKPGVSTPYFDKRQRAVAKIHYFNHAGGGGAALKAHGKYIARDAAREGPHRETADDERENDVPTQERAHADYLQRKGRGEFYDKTGTGVDGAACLETWAKSDLRHFRIILSAEEGQRLRDLQAYTREVMARAGAALGTELSWVAVDHKDTDNPHTHIVVRGRRSNGQDLVLPRDFIKHGFRGIAQDVATEWLGDRTPEQERLSYQREIRRHGLTKLDGVIDICAQKHTVDLNRLEAPNGDPNLAQAAKARVQELARMGLAEDQGNGLFRLMPDWRDRLKAMDLHLDIRKRMMRERVERGLAQHHAARTIRKGLLDR
jgi:type IV secretory pathway VirD2 relaxase